jgi:hypothetical protein
MRARRRLFVLAQPVARDSPADVLIPDHAVHQRGTSAAPRRLHGRMANDGAVYVAEHIGIGFALIVMRIDVDDQEFIVFALPRLA